MGVMPYEEKAIPEANGYTVDTLGIVRNKNKDGREIGKIKYDDKGEMVNDYRKVTLFGKQKPVHRLVAIAFIPNPENKPTVNHINGLKWDCRVENLEWHTEKENNNHARQTRLNKAENGNLSLLTKEEVIEIWKDKSKDNKLTAPAIIKRLDLDVTPAAIRNIWNRKTKGWNRITDELLEEYPWNWKIENK